MRRFCGIILALAVVFPPCFSPAGESAPPRPGGTAAAGKFDQAENGAIAAYRDANQNLEQPGCGIFGGGCEGEWTPVPGKVSSRNPKGRYFFLINLQNYSGRMNKGKKDLPLDPAFFQGLRQTLENARQNGATLGIRFRYTWDSVNGPEPDWPNLIGHLQAVLKSKLFTQYGEMVAWCEAGTLGAWGEMHSTRYRETGYSTELIDLYLKMFPPHVPVLLRTTNRITAWVNEKLGTDYTEKNIDAMAAEVQSRHRDARNRAPRYFSKDGKDFSTGNRVADDLERLGLYNDGYLGTKNDYGTFRDRARETAFLATRTRAVYGGEYSYDRPHQMGWGEPNEVWWPVNAIPEMYRTHLAYLHWGPWKTAPDKYVFAGKTPPGGKMPEAELAKLREKAEKQVAMLDAVYGRVGARALAGTPRLAPNTAADGKTVNGWKVEFTAVGYDTLKMTPETARAAQTAAKVNLTDYLGLDLHTFICQHMGYRFVVRQSALSAARARPGATVTLNLSVENTGFGAMAQPKRGEILFVQNGAVKGKTALNGFDGTAWAPGMNETAFTFTVPKNLAPGRCDVYLKMALPGDDGAPARDGWRVKFANPGMYRPEFGANLAARLDITR